MPLKSRKRTRGKQAAVQTEPSELLACIAISPSCDLSYWQDAIQSAARPLSFQIILDDGESLSVSDPSCTIVITQRPDRALVTHARHRILLIGDLEDTATALAVEGDLVAGAIQASADLAEASVLVGAYRTISLKGDGGSFSLWPGFELQTSKRSVSVPCDEPIRAWSEALQAHLGPPGRLGIRARWGPQVFRYNSVRAHLRPQLWEFDVTGPARNLIYGPYLSLTPGLWRSILRFVVDDDAASLRYRAEWGTRTEYVHETFIPGRAGVFEIALDYDYSETTQAELRIILTEGSLGGAFEFLGMELERLV